MHDTWLDQLPYYVAGTLPEAERAALDQHLAGCENCRRALDEWRAIGATVHDDTATRSRHLPPLRAMPQPAPGRLSAVRIGPHRRTLRWAAAWAATILIAFALGVGAASYVDETGASGPHAASVLIQATGEAPEPLPGDPLPTTAQLDLSLAPVPQIPRLHEEPSYLIHPGTTSTLLALNYLGVTGFNPPTYQVDLSDLHDPIRATTDDKTVTVQDIAAFVNEQTDMRALVRLGGTVDLVERLVAGGYPVIAATTFQLEPERASGPVRLYADYHVIAGYDRDERTLLAYDAYDLRRTSFVQVLPYSAFETLWTPFTNTFIVVYPPEDETRVMDILGVYADAEVAARAAFDQGLVQTSETGDDPLAWLKLGNACLALGKVDQAADAYDMAFNRGLPLTLLQHQFGPFEVYYETGRYDDLAQRLSAVSPTGDTGSEEWHTWDGLAHAALGEPDEAIRALDRALAINPDYEPAQTARAAIEPNTTFVATAEPDDSSELPALVWLEGVRYEAQTWNNDGPATLAMALSFYGWDVNQQNLREVLQPHDEDKSVQPLELVRFVETSSYTQDLHAVYRQGGDANVLKRLLAAGFPVIVQQGFQPAGEDWMGHYVLLTGYDDAENAFLTYDSYLGPGNTQGLPQRYGAFDETWRQFNRAFLVIYEADQQDALDAALGNYADPDYGAQAALALGNDDDAFAWFSQGTSYVALKDYENAALAYDRAFQLDLPWRMLWYQFGPYNAYYNTGRYDDVLTLARTNLGTTTNVEETYYWQGMAYAALGQTEQARDSLEEALRLNPNDTSALIALAKLEPSPFATPEATEAAES